jgi:hypothetical protein
MAVGILTGSTYRMRLVTERRNEEITAENLVPFE